MKALGGIVIAVALVFMFAGEQNIPAASGGPEVQKAGGMVHRVIFGADEVRGGRESPGLLEIEVVRPPKHPNLIKYRDNFNQKVIGSVNAL